jgi:flavin-binding protein dodecin
MQDDDVPGGVVKVIELVGSSPNSFSDAVRNAVATAAQSLRNIQGVEVLSSSANVGPDGTLTLYKVNCKVAFLVEGASAGSLEQVGDLGTSTGQPL